MLNRFALFLIFVFTLTQPIFGLAAETKPFDQTAFQTLQATGKPVLVAIHADWCTVCATQKPVLSKLLAQPEFKNYAMLTVNFDKQKDVVRTFGVRQQSTLIVFKGKEERARSTGETNEEKIRALLRKAAA